MKIEAAGALGLGAITMDLFGLPVHPIVWGVIGSFVGATWAPSMPGWRAFLMYPAAALLSALLGQWVAHHWFTDDRIVAMGAAGVLGVVFHPLMSAVVASLPALVQRLSGGVKQ